MRRGDIVVVALPGDLGKPRPAVVVQSDDHDRTTGVTVVPITSLVSEDNLIRITILPGSANGLREPSQIMTDKVITIPRGKVRQVIGKLDKVRLRQLSSHLALFLGLV